MNTAPRKCFKATDAYPASEVTATMASALAIGSILFKDKDLNYSNILLDGALKTFKFANDYKGNYSSWFVDESIIYSSSYWDELIESACLLYLATL